MGPVSKVLCAIDIGDRPIGVSAEAVVRAADREARIDGAALVVLHVLPLDPGAPMSPAGAEAQVLDTQELSSILVDSILAEVTRVTGRPPDQVAVMVETGAAASTIVDTAKRIGAELIVVGRNGARALRRILLGNVATKVAQEAPCSVLVVRPPSS